MEKPRVIITSKLPEEAYTLLASHAEIISFNDKQPSRNELMAAMAEADGFLNTGYVIDEDFLSNAPRLKIVSNIAVGYNNFDTQAMKRHNIWGTITPNVLNNSVADLIISLMLAVSRRMAYLDAYVRAGKWSSGIGEELYGLEMTGKRLGIIGMGRIGETVAKKARFGFDMDIVYSNRNKKEDVQKELNALWLSLEDLLKTSDYIVVMTPLNDDTQHMISWREFEIMKVTAIFVNASRGQVVEETALVAALRNNQIFGAGLDVFDKEPLEMDNPLLELPNTVLTPHIGSAIHKTRDDMTMLAIKNLIEGIEGRTPPDLVKELR